MKKSNSKSFSDDCLSTLEQYGKSPRSKRDKSLCAARLSLTAIKAALAKKGSIHD